MNAYSSSYHNNQIMTASREQILIMLYDGAIRFVRQAKKAIEENRLGDKAQAISRVVAIVTEFSNTLDYEVGGEIAIELSQLYDFMIRELIAANANSEIERLDSIEKILLDLREGFAEAIKKNRQQQTLQRGQQSSQERLAVSF